VGEGDIIEHNLGLHCSQDEFLASEVSCENDITQEILDAGSTAKYEAVPKSGWRFVGWEGSCAEDSEFPYCEIEYQAPWVAWWDAGLYAGVVLRNQAQKRL
jgi:hypothetical protein